MTAIPSKPAGNLVRDLTHNVFALGLGVPSGNVKEELLIELTHLPIAVLGITAGWARWLEVEAPQDEGRWAGWVWPACFVAIGLLLLAYRES